MTIIQDGANLVHSDQYVPFLHLFVFVVGQYDINITGIEWQYERTVEDVLTTRDTDDIIDLPKQRMMSVILPLTLAGSAVLIILMGCLGVLFHFMKR